MTNQLQTFMFEGSTTPVRVVAHENSHWFVATDIAKILGYRDAPEMTRILDDDEVDYYKILDSNRRGNPNVTIINESGLYAATFRSNKPEAKAFKKWVTASVLPTIRQQGAYVQAAEALPQTQQAAMYKLFREMALDALHRHDHATQDNHWIKSPEKRLRSSQMAAVSVAKQMGLPLSFVMDAADNGVDFALNKFKP